MVNLCNGITSPRERYSLSKIASIKKMLPIARERLIKEFGDIDHDRGILAGSRFNNDDSIVARLESVVDQNTIKAVGWEQVIRGALIDAMTADYWYMYEKDYGEADNDLGRT